MITSVADNHDYWETQSNNPNGTVSLYFFANRKLECFQDLRPLHGNNYRHQPIHSVLVVRLKQNGFLISDADY